MGKPLAEANDRRMPLNRRPVLVMGGSTELCRYCHEITERTSDGDRLACSACGRPYLVTPPGPPGVEVRGRPDQGSAAGADDP